MNVYTNNLWQEINDMQAVTVLGGATNTTNTQIQQTASEPQFTYPLRLRVSGQANLALYADLDLKIDIGVQKSA